MSASKGPVALLLRLEGIPSDLHRLLLGLAHTGAWLGSGNPGGSSARPPGSQRPGGGTPAPGQWALWPQKEGRGLPGRSGWLRPGTGGPGGGGGQEKRIKVKVAVITRVEATSHDLPGPI